MFKILNIFNVIIVCVKTMISDDFKKLNTKSSSGKGYLEVANSHLTFVFRVDKLRDRTGRYAISCSVKGERDRTGRYAISCSVKGERDWIQSDRITFPFEERKEYIKEMLNKLEEDLKNEI